MHYRYHSFIHRMQHLSQAAGEGIHIVETVVYENDAPRALHMYVMTTRTREELLTAFRPELPVTYVYVDGSHYPFLIQMGDVTFSDQVRSAFCQDIYSNTPHTHASLMRRYEPSWRSAFVVTRVAGAVERQGTSYGTFVTDSGLRPPIATRSLDIRVHEEDRPSARLRFKVAETRERLSLFMREVPVGTPVVVEFIQHGGTRFPSLVTAYLPNMTTRTYAFAQPYDPYMVVRVTEYGQVAAVRIAQVLQRRGLYSALPKNMILELEDLYVDLTRVSNMQQLAEPLNRFAKLLNLKLAKPLRRAEPEQATVSLADVVENSRQGYTATYRGPANELPQAVDITNLAFQRRYSTEFRPVNYGIASNGTA